MPLTYSALPLYTGEYKVGAIDLEVECEPRVISDVVLKETGELALKVGSAFTETLDISSTFPCAC